jgi:hypothetical protein
VSRSHGLGDLADELVRVVGLQRAGGEQRGEFHRVRKPLVDDVDQVVLLDGVEDLNEARVAEECRGPRGGQHRAGPRMLRGKEVDPDGPAQFLVDGAPTAESVQTGDALLQTVASGEFVTAVQLRRHEGGLDALGLVSRVGRLVGSGLLRVLLSFRHPVGRGLLRRVLLGGQRLVATVVGHVDGSRATFRHRRSCLPIRCALSNSQANCAHSPVLCTTREGRRWLCFGPRDYRPRRPRTIPTMPFSSSIRIFFAAT